MVGLLLLKRLVGLDPRAGKTLQEVGLVDMPLVRQDTPLYDMLNEFQNGKSKGTCYEALLTRAGHMAMVTNEERLIGIITLEDVFEELIQEEIVDETDVYVDVSKKLQLAQMLRRMASPFAAVQRSIDLSRQALSLERRQSIDSRRSMDHAPARRGTSTSSPRSVMARNSQSNSLASLPALDTPVQPSDHTP